MKLVIVILSLTMFVLALSAEINNFNENMGEILKHYLVIQYKLSNDSIEDILHVALEAKKVALQLDPQQIDEQHQEHFTELSDKILTSLEIIIKGESIDEIRTGFNDLSKPMIMWAQMSEQDNIIVFYCSMAPGSWIQTSKELMNPYFGSEMLKCGEQVYPKSDSI